MVIAPPINTGTFGVAPQDAGVAAATVTVDQMLGGSVGTSPLNTIRASAVASYLTAHLALAGSSAARPDRADAGTRLRHRVLVDRRHLRPGTWQGANRTSHGRPRPSGMTPLAGTSAARLSVVDRVWGALVARITRIR